MKNCIRIILGYSLVRVSLVLLSSCEDYLDKEPETIVGPEEAFKNFANFQGFTEELYMCIPDFSNAYWTNSFNWGDDEITSADMNYHIVNKFDDGDFWGWQREYDGWGASWLDRGDAASRNNDRFTKDIWNNMWYGIRKANLGLENMDLLTDATTEEKNFIRGQLLFFRGWFHFQLIQYFGGLPYINSVLPSDGALREPRLSYRECADLAAADLRGAADLLPVNWDGTQPGSRTQGKNDLRINKIMALGYLGKNYLWAASPLMNFESTGARTYDAEYSKMAASAFGELLTLVENGGTPYSLLAFEDYSDNFYTIGQGWRIPGGTEAIFRGPYFGANGSNYGTTKQYQPAVLQDASNFMPTANYVNYYGMANGLPITDITKPDPVSGYDPQYPWKDRDPRFYHDIIYDGVQVVQGSMPDDVEANRYANLFTGGSYRDVSTGSRTGFLNYKFIPITANRYDDGFNYGNNLNLHLPWMRLSDVYLMYAEAAAQGYGSPNGKSGNFSRTAIEAVNVVRERAGVGPVSITGGDDVASGLGGFMSELRRERAVELAFEGHRINDLRRWMLLISKPYTVKTSLEFDRAGDFSTEDPTLNRVLNIREEIILERNYSSKHYWLPLKTADVSLYEEFSQNPGW